MAKQCGRGPLVRSEASPAEVRVLAEALVLLGAVSMSSSPWFPTEMCKEVGGKVLTRLSLVILMPGGKGEVGPQGGQLQLSKEKQRGEQKKSLHAGLAI